LKTIGLIGYPLAHSFSPAYFAQKFKQLGIDHLYQYKLFELKNIAQLPNLLLQNPDIIGFNVTIPHKTAIMPYLHSISPEAQAIGAVNTVKITNDGELHGHNTDVLGFENSIKQWLSPNQSSEMVALVLGSGGASKAACFVLQKYGIMHQVVRRTGQITYEMLLDATDLQAIKRIINPNICDDALLYVINATPVGTAPDVLSAPLLPYHFFDGSCFLFDMVYNPPQTAFLKMGEKYHCHTQNGLRMLHLQADTAWRIFDNDM
jgi:shikimate dehydrogenase